ncbi:MAG: carboxypeptidase regulatory-like domain-containing protein [Acidobacteriota bacterium]
MKLSKLLFAWFAIIALSSPALLSQTHRASIRGTVSGPAGNGLAGATITLTNDSTAEERRTTSNEAGGYSVSLLSPGRYQLTAELDGYKKAVEKIGLHVHQELRLNLRLEVGAPSDEVVVTAPRSTLRRESAALGTVIETRQITGLPLDGRNFLQLSLLAPGAAPAAPGSAGSVRGDFAFNVNGARENSNSFLLDGVYNLDPKLNTFAVNPPVDAINEFEILTSSYDASFGRSAGAQVNVVLKSGGNAFHGAAYEFLRHDALDARNFFAPGAGPAPRYRRNQFGASLGGPLEANRTFFFADYEGTRVREGITRLSNVPTAAERAGDFSASLFRRPIDPFTQQPFPGGRITANRIHPVGGAIAALYPLPNRAEPFQNFVSSPLLRDRNDHFDARIDHSIGESSDLAVRYSFGDRDLYDPFSGPAFATVPGYGTNIPRRGQNVMVSETHVLSPSLLNEARFAFNRVAAGSFHENLGRSLNRSVGLPELSTNQRDFGLSFITVSGYSPLGDEFNNPQHSVTNTFQFLDTASLARGNHLVKFGVDVRATQQNAFRDVQSRGFLTFSDQVPITTNALADLLIGFPLITGGARVDNHQHLRTESYNAYVHDHYRMRSNLTVSAGLRYEYNSPSVDAFNRTNLYDPATRSLLAAGSAGMPRAGHRSDRNNWAPRIGLAWTPHGSQSTVVRAGYGVYYDQAPLAPSEALYFNVPYFDFSLFFSLPGLPLTLSDPFPRAFPFPLPDTALAIQRDLKTAFMQHWNWTVQQQLGRNRILEAGYVGSRGTKLLTARDINQPRPSAQQFNPRPVPQFDDINLLESRGNSSYHSLQLRFQQSLDTGLSVLSSYTWSKSLDDASHFFSSAGDPNFPQDSFNVAAERGRSNFDVRQRFSASFSYELPIGKGHARLGDDGWISSLLGGWQTWGIVTLQTGRPFTVALLPEIDNSNTGRSSLGFGANDRPHRTGAGTLSNPQPGRWFDTSAFTFPARGNFGNSGRNILDGDGFQNVNLSLIKDTALGENLTLQLRAESFNLFNHPNLDLPDNFLGSPTFGRIVSAQSPRRIQFGLKLIF